MGRIRKDLLRPLCYPEIKELERIAHTTSERLDVVQRARALLSVASGSSLCSTAKSSGFSSHESVTWIVKRFNERGLASLDIAPGRGRHCTYDSAARTHIISEMERAPDRERDGTATWSTHLLAASLRRSSPTFSNVSASTVRRVLHEAGYSLQNNRTWCHTGHAKRRRKNGEVVDVLDPRAEGKKT